MGSSTVVIDRSKALHSGSAFLYWTSDDLNTGGNECDYQQNRCCQVDDFNSILNADQENSDQKQDALPVCMD